MDTSVEEIIKNIIQIDKTADEMRQSFEVQVKQRKQLMNKEVEKLREKIVESEVLRVKEIREEEINKTIKETEKIRERASAKSREMYEKYLYERQSLIQKIFNDVLKWLPLRVIKI